MAIRLLQSSVIANYEVTAANTFRAGQGLIRDTANANAVRLPGTDEVTVYNFAGLSLADHLTTGNTMIQNDPVGSAVVSADGSTFTSYANGFFVGAKRAIGDFQDETASVVTNLTDTAPTPHRGVGCARQQGTQFVTDQFDTAGTYAANTACYIGDADASNEGLITSANSGGTQLVSVDNFDATAGLLFGTIVA
jgi:hypothetical protein